MHALYIVTRGILKTNFEMTDPWPADLLATVILSPRMDQTEWRRGSVAARGPAATRGVKQIAGKLRLQTPPHPMHNGGRASPGLGSRGARGDKGV